MITDYITIGQTVSAIITIICILLQQRGMAIGAAFGGASEHYSTQRGMQKNLFYASIVFGIIFIALSLARLAIK
ncbi:MAG: preprotein translocase subunit SecG [Candidatus Paceibacterota bacterium]